MSCGSLPSSDVSSKQNLFLLYRTAFVGAPDIDFNSNTLSVKACWEMAGGECLSNGYQYRCCCDLTPFGCKSDWIEKRKCENGSPVGNWEKISDTDCTTILLNLYQYGCQRISINDFVFYIPISKEKYISLLKENEGINVDEGFIYCRMIGTPPYAHCMGDCNQDFQYCKMQNFGDYFYCTCSI